MLEYLYGMMDVFGPKMDEYVTGEARLVDNEDNDEVSACRKRYDECIAN